MIVKQVRNMFSMALTSHPVMCKRCGKVIKKERKPGVETCQRCLNKGK